ncbi:MAG: metallophosphoesterase [Eubacteriales bacterium]|nr:metallophosphoesterase [Eubacteriales bacterium]
MGKRKNAYLFAPQKQGRSHLGAVLIMLMMLLAVVLIVVMTNYGVNHKVTLETEKVHVMGLDKTFEGFSVLHISDLHASALGSDPEIWSSLLFGKSFNAVVLSGDMVGTSGNYEPLLSLIHTLKQLRADIPVYFIAGDDDPPAVLSSARGTPEVLAEWVRAAQQEGAIYLDAPIAQPVGKKNVWFTPQYLYDVEVDGMVSALGKQREEMEGRGTQYDAEGGASYRALCYRIEAYERTQIALKSILSTDLQIAVNHAPLEASYIRESIEWADQDKPFNFRNISLLLCGHYCGGQWRLPWDGAIYVPDVGWFPPDDGLVGMQRINSLNQYISSGIGASEYYPMKGRLFNKPTVTLLTYTAKLE